MAPLTVSGFDPNSLLHTSIDSRSIQLNSVLGVGAYGVVYLGIHLYTSHRYAVKLLTKPDTTTKEIELHTRVSDHRGVLELEKVVRENGRVFLVLEYASRGDLFSAITQEQGVAGNNRAIRSIFLQIVDAVQYCHDHGVAHRDLKPENILMFPDHTVKLADFGLATTQSVSNEFGCGSSFYYSPECQGQVLVQNRPIKGYSTRQNDVWSLGIILVNLAAGRNPWRQATLKDPAFAAYCKSPNQGFFKHILPSISDALAELLARIFTLDPAHRISLPELRVRAAAIKSFSTSDNLATMRNTTDTRATAAVGSNDAIGKELLKVSGQSSSSPVPLATWTRSFLHTVCDYASGFVVEEEQEQLMAGLSSRRCPVAGRFCWAATHSPPMPCSCVSPCSSISSTDFPTTPHRRLSTAAVATGNHKIDVVAPVDNALGNSNGADRYQVFQ